MLKLCTVKRNKKKAVGQNFMSLYEKNNQQRQTMYFSEGLKDGPFNLRNIGKHYQRPTEQIWEMLVLITVLIDNIANS